jgi:hypothetical protein
VVVVYTNAKIGEIGLMFFLYPGYEGFCFYSLMAGAQHDRRAVGIIGADIVTLVSAHLLEARPNIGLDVLHQMAKVDRTIGVGQGAGD